MDREVVRARGGKRHVDCCSDRFSPGQRTTEEGGASAQVGALDFTGLRDFEALRFVGAALAGCDCTYGVGLRPFTSQSRLAGREESDGSFCVFLWTFPLRDVRSKVERHVMCAVHGSRRRSCLIMFADVLPLRARFVLKPPYDLQVCDVGCLHTCVRALR